MSQRLIEYIKAMQTREWGCRDKYEKNLGGGSRPEYPMLTGHYGGMLDEAISAIGEDRLLRLLSVQQEIDDAARGS